MTSMMHRLACVVCGGLATVAGAIQFEPTATTQGAAPDRLRSIESFVSVYEARDQGWTSGEWGTLAFINQQWDGFLSTSSADTATHEGTHLLQAQLANKQFELGRDVEPIFVPDSGVAFLKHPPVLRKTIPDRVPPALRGGRFELYVNAEASGAGPGTAGGADANVLYLWNEWNAYLNGTTVTVEQAEKGTALSAGEQSELSQIVGPVEFFAYGVATLAAVKDGIGDKYSEQDYQTLKEAFEIETDRALDLLRRGDALPERYGAAEARKVIVALRDDGDERTVKLREFLVCEFGEDWVNERLNARRHSVAVVRGERRSRRDARGWR